jgi:hypothetical protein
MISGKNQWDYVTDSLLHGLRTILRSGFVEEPKRHHMYKGGQAAAKASGFVEYGKGFSYAYALDDLEIDRSATTLLRMIFQHDFDLVIIGQMHSPNSEATL